MKRFIRKLARFLPDKMYISLMYFKHFKRFPNLKNPQTFNEKLQWLKLYDRKPEYTTMVDKYLVKKYIADKIGPEYVIPTLGVWKTAEQIDFDALPDQFVLKCNHNGSGNGIIICYDKSELDKEKAIETLNKCLRDNGYWYGREWPYKNIKPCVLAEQLLVDAETAELRDYKFFCFNGEAKMMFIASERQKRGEEVKFDFFDMNFNHILMQQGHPNALVNLQKPVMFEKMKELAETLSKGMPQLRVDFYEVNGNIFFGELTLYHFSGLVPFEPEEWDHTLGSWIELHLEKE